MPVAVGGRQNSCLYLDHLDTFAPIPLQIALSAHIHYSVRHFIRVQSRCRIRGRHEFIRAATDAFALPIGEQD